MKQETLEEAVEIYVWGGIYLNEAEKQQTEIAFIEGAKWQAEQLFKDDAIQTLETCLKLLLKKQEKMYSEEEVIEILLNFRGENPRYIEEWFEQFKKK